MVTYPGPLPLAPPAIPLAPQRQTTVDPYTATRLLRMDQDVFGGMHPAYKVRETLPALEAAVKANAGELRAVSQKILSDTYGLMLSNGMIHPAKWGEAQQLAAATAEEVSKRANAATWVDMMDSLGLTQTNLARAANQGLYYWA